MVKIKQIIIFGNFMNKQIIYFTHPSYPQEQWMDIIVSTWIHLVSLCNIETVVINRQIMQQ